MNSRTTPAFWACFRALPEQAQQTARRAFGFWLVDRNHPGLRFKQLNGRPGIWSVRVGAHWRALGKMDSDTITWFWIGSHADYDRVVGE